MVWMIELDPSAEKELDKLDSQQARRILRFLFERVAHLKDPRSIGEALKGSRFNTLWKYRVGDYRIITSLEDSSARLIVVKIGDRKEVYS
ncbi:MAG: type II toxin-antitoxin system RelE/ParE family toxin [Alphaproteobacteria bacterium]